MQLLQATLINGPADRKLMIILATEAAEHSFLSILYQFSTRRKGTTIDRSQVHPRQVAKQRPSTPSFWYYSVGFHVVLDQYERNLSLNNSFFYCCTLHTGPKSPNCFTDTFLRPMVTIFVWVPRRQFFFWFHFSKVKSGWHLFHQNNIIIFWHFIEHAKYTFIRLLSKRSKKPLYFG